MSRMSGKVAFITGAGSGIGRASARLFVEQGARVVVAELDADKGRASAEALGDAGIFVRTDVKDEDSVRDALAAVRARSARSTRSSIAPVVRSSRTGP